MNGYWWEYQNDANQCFAGWRAFPYVLIVRRDYGWIDRINETDLLDSTFEICMEMFGPCLWSYTASEDLAVMPQRCMLHYIAGFLHGVRFRYEDDALLLLLRLN
jgi:hypothetical protein